MTEDRLLEVGDEVTGFGYGEIIGIYKIERVTAKQAIMFGGGKVRREVESHGYVKMVGGGLWDTTTYHLTTDEDRKVRKETVVKRLIIKITDKIKTEIDANKKLDIDKLRIIKNGLEDILNKINEGKKDETDKLENA